MIAVFHIMVTARNGIATAKCGLDLDSAEGVKLRRGNTPHYLVHQVSVDEWVDKYTVCDACTLLSLEDDV